MRNYLPLRLWSARGALAVSLIVGVFAAGCHKKPPVQPPPAPAPTAPPAATPPPAQPTVMEFSAEPSSIERGQSAILRWSVSNATDISIDNGVGTVPASGNRRVIPSDTTTYTLRATGPGGNITATATVTVTAPAPPPPPPTENKGTLESRIQSDLQDAYFDYDSNNIRGDARTALTADAEALKRIFADFPSATIMIEGNCDERGSAEYNLGLGDRRASAAKDFLVSLGVPADKLKTISYGKERPVCTESNESCWQRNRHDHFSAGQ
jgi:peptidoglycan-associated lipoprotein